MVDSAPVSPLAVGMGMGMMAVAVVGGGVSPRLPPHLQPQPALGFDADADAGQGQGRGGQSTRTRVACGPEPVRSVHAAAGLFACHLQNAIGEGDSAVHAVLVGHIPSPAASLGNGITV
jgi:hypothetical protein